MAEYWAFLNMLRHALGKGYTVAEEHTIGRQHVTLLIRRQRHEELLAIATDLRWLASLQEGDPTARDGYKRFVALVRAFFATPEALPSHTFTWPGTPEGRAALERLLFTHRGMARR